MLEFRNVLDVAYGAYVVNGAYSMANGSTAAPERGAAVAIIQELLRGNFPDIYQSAHDSSTAVSVVQTFADGVDTIGDKLAAMEELAKKASSPDYSQTQIEEMQEQFEDLAEAINQIVDSTEYDFNKLLTAEGESISISIGNGSTIDIFARDLSFDAEGLDLTSDPEAALSQVEGATGELEGYRRYLTRQAERLEDATAIIESELGAAAGVDLSDFSMELAMEVATYAASQVLEDSSTLLNTQANISSDRALRLLADNT
jgi:flagellin-like hook-associated protein FlgL